MDNQRLLIIGASSYVGARLFYDLRDRFRVVGSFCLNKSFDDLIHLDITNQKEVEQVIVEEAPDIIIHLASNASSRWCDANPEEAVLLNQVATEHIVSSANAQGARVIYISTMGAIHPTNLYGKTKSESEKIVKGAKAGYLILRPSLILGLSPNTTNDRPFNRLLRNLEMGVPAIYDTSWKFQPTYLRHISEVIEACLERNIWNETITIAVPDLKSRYDTARDILTPFGITVTPVDNHDTTFAEFADELIELKNLGLPIYRYAEMIDAIVEEIKHRG